MEALARSSSDAFAKPADAFATLSPEQLAVVDGAFLNVGVAWGDNNRVSVGTGTRGLNLQFAWGNNNHVETGQGPTFRLNWGSGNTFDSR